MKSLIFIAFFLCYNLTYSQNNDEYLKYLSNLVAKGQEQTAISSLDSAIETSPQIPDFYYMKSEVFQSLGSFFDALDILTKCMKYNPDAVDAYIERGSIFDLLGEFDAAIVEYAQAIKKAQDDKTKCIVYRNRALIYIQQKNMTAACADITTGLELKFTEMYGQELEDLKNKYCK